jgi:hypothetical protein
VVTLFFIGGVFLVVLLDFLIIKRIEPGAGERAAGKGDEPGRGEA